MDDPVFTSREARRGALLRATGLLVTLVGSGLLLELYAPFLLDPAWLRAAIRSYGTLAPLVFVGVQTVQVVAAPISALRLGGWGRGMKKSNWKNMPSDSRNGITYRAIWIVVFQPCWNHT